MEFVTRDFSSPFEYFYKSKTKKKEDKILCCVPTVKALIFRIVIFNIRQLECNMRMKSNSKIFDCNKRLWCKQKQTKKKVKKEEEDKPIWKRITPNMWIYHQQYDYDLDMNYITINEWKKCKRLNFWNASAEKNFNCRRCSCFAYFKCIYFAFADAGGLFVSNITA